MDPTGREEKSFPGFKHFGDFMIFDGKLFARCVEGGSAEVWTLNNGEWKMIFPKDNLKKYGVGSDLVNAAGFFTTCNDKLYFSLNNAKCGRAGPGYILEITKEKTASLKTSNFLVAIPGTMQFFFSQITPDDL